MPDAVAVVQRYLDRLAANDWAGVEQTLALGVVRRGPYRDDYVGRDHYVAFLRETFGWMRDYEMDVARVWSDGDTRVCAELSETVTLDGRRLRTDEAIIFDLDGQHTIALVQVFLRTSYDPTDSL